MSYIVYQNIKGRLYAYEVVAYWDKKKKQARQIRKYLGVYDPKTNKIIRKREIKIVSAMDYGDVAFAYQNFKEVNLNDILRSVYGDLSDVLEVLCLSRIVNPCPLRRVGKWFERTYLSNRKVNLSSQNISRVLEYVGGNKHMLQDFFSHWIGKCNRKLTLFYDITSMESLSKINHLLEYGYSKSGRDTPMLNFGVVMDYNRNLPLYYKIFPGSLPDVKTLRMMIMELKSFGIRDCLLILDKGFYSQPNLCELKSMDMDFIIPLPFSVNLADEIIQKHSCDIELPENTISHHGRVLHIVTGNLRMCNTTLYYLLYYDKKRAADESNKFYHRLFEIEDRLQSVKLKSKDNVDIIIKEIAGRYLPYIHTKVKNNRIYVQRNGETITRFLRRLGKSILLTSYKMSAVRMLDYYMSKDDVEKAFRTIKTDLEGLPMRTHGAETTEGYLFIIFLSAVVQTYIRNKLQKYKIDKPLPDILLELSKIRKVVLQDGKTFTTELTKKQRELIAALKMKLDIT